MLAPCMAETVNGVHMSLGPCSVSSLWIGTPHPHLDAVFAYGSAGNSSFTLLSGKAQPALQTQKRKGQLCTPAPSGSSCRGTVSHCPGF